MISVAWLLSGCGDSECAGHARTECVEGATYWVDSCGEPQELREVCQCGCEDDGSACRRCNCTCTQETLCCDGCLPVHEGMICNDGDPDTVSERCQSGACTGWRISEMAEPAQPAEPVPPEPVRLQSWDCPAGWGSVVHPELQDQNGDPFSWCEPPPLPRLSVDTYNTPLKDGETDSDRPVCEPLVDGTFPLLGQAQCQPLGDACPAGEWPDIPAEVAGNRIYVRAGATGGNGSQAVPFGMLSEAVIAAAPGDVVVIAAGTYPESVVVSKDLTLWGKCTAEVIIEAPGPYSGGGAVEVTGGTTVAIRNLRISGEQNGVLVNATDVQVRIEGVWVHEAASRGVAVINGSATLTGALITSTRLNPSGGGGMGVFVWGEAAAARVESSTIENNPSAGITAGSDTPESGAAAVDLADVTVRETYGRPGDTTWGMGCYFAEGAQATGTRILLDRNRLDGILAYGEGTQIELSDLVVLDTLPVSGDAVTGMGVEVVYAQATLRRALIRNNHIAGVLFYRDGAVGHLEDVVIADSQGSPASGMFGRGLDVETGARVTLWRGLLERNREEGVLVEGEGTRVELFDLVVLDTKSWERDPPILGRGLNVQAAASVRLERGRFERNRDLGIVAMQAGTVLDMTDVIVLDTQSQESDGLFGRGLYIKDGARASLLRGWFEKNREVGILTALDGTYAEMEDVTVLETQSREADLGFGSGLVVITGSWLKLDRGRIQGNRAVGVSVSDASQLELRDTVIRETLEQEADLLGGVALQASGGSQVVLESCLLQGNREMGVGGFGAGTSVTLRRVSVQDTLERACVSVPGEGNCADYGAGIGLGAYDGASIALEDVETVGCSLVGAQLARLGWIEGQGLSIRENPIGVNLQDIPVGYDFFDRVNNLWMSDNGINFDARFLEIPPAMDVLEE